METIIQYGWSIKTKTNELVIRKHTFNVLPKIKFKRKKEKKVRIGKDDLGSFKMEIPFKLVKVNINRSWLGDGMQGDDINCSEEWTEEIKKYSKTDFDAFLKDCINSIGLPINLEFNANMNHILF
tara:strand:- start:486 stop:860 length:375 start_codon:yes stop_codon:yes gene_type:complete